MCTIIIYIERHNLRAHNLINSMSIYRYFSTLILYTCIDNVN